MVNGKCHHSRAAWDDQDGSARYSGHERQHLCCKQGGTVELRFFDFTPDFYLRGEVFLPLNS